MNKINMKQWKNSLLESNERKAIPIMTHPGIDIIGKRVLDAVTDGEVHYRAIRALAGIYPTAAATIIMDLTVEAQAFGCQINFADNEVPTVNGRLVKDKASIEALAIPTLQSGRIPEYLAATRMACESIQHIPVLGGCIGPFSLAGRLYDMTEIMTAVYIEPESIQLLVEKCASFILEYAKAMKKAGAHGIIMAEPAAGLLDTEACEEYSSRLIRKIVQEIQDDSFLFILHNCGNTGHLTQSMVSTGAQGLHFGNNLDIVEALKVVPSDILVLGNLDPVGAFKMMNPESMKKATTLLLQKTKEYRNFVLSSGCDTPPHVHIRNIEVFYEALCEFNKCKPESIESASLSSSKEKCSCCHNA